MIGTSLWDYIFIRACIFFLHLIAPVSIIYTLVNVLVGLPFQLPQALQVWLALEASFYLVVYLPYSKYLQKAARHPALPCREDRRKLFKRCHETIPDPVQYLRKWFRGAAEAEIKRENVKDFFRWAFLNTGEIESVDEDELEEYVREMETLLGRKLQPGRGRAECLRLTLDKVEMLHRSLTWYSCVFIVDLLTSIYLRYHSFDFYRSSVLRSLAIFPARPHNVFSSYRSPAESLTYWHRPHTSKTRLPVLFIHGIGIGLYPYIDFLADINASGAKRSLDGQLGIIAIEIMSVSSRITAEAMSKEQICNEICHILEAHGWDKCVLVSHSYGSVVAAHLLRSPKIVQKIGPVLFVDPVSFLLHLPDVAYNFICREPRRANEYLLSYFGSKDMGISHTLFRRFFWADNVLWTDDISKHRVSVVLAGRDIVTDTKVIRAYLEGPKDTTLKRKAWEDVVWRDDGLEVEWFPQFDHGQVFDDEAGRSRLVRISSPSMRILLRVAGALQDPWDGH
ncbi:uncharacterized protein BBA_09668 [Beauveria bassiana ARSEF 2860]|uniref:AB hydrolase-1 domain-containing protein n=1 Tax=Beauveria bassiana (strain ARSEF 2860) TaxID=655819 RepID=J4UFM4_BEAB2|nr:uncharacterized protein BBA_09668 [Beauveria bassiana ARSEF 2860]EJP61372.1 hypothetical protein BBA_09668 [Beauveria bassiana ARSEF 2860]